MSARCKAEIGQSGEGSAPLTKATTIIQSSAMIFALLNRRAMNLSITAAMAALIHMAQETTISCDRSSLIWASSFLISAGGRCDGILARR